jgi:hypothetical protein
MLLDISTWWSSKELFEQIYWIIAFPSTLIFVILLIMTFVAGDVDGDAGGADADIDADEGIGFQFFTIKNLVGFFTIFSWSGLACIDGGLGIFATILISIVCGLVMMAIMAGIFYFMSTLTDSGTLNLKNAINGIGDVYLPVKAERSGFGKVQINIQGQLRTLDAMTDDETDLPTGTIIKVTDIINNEILLVTKSTK